MCHFALTDPTKSPLRFRFIKFVNFTQDPWCWHLCMIHKETFCLHISMSLKQSLDAAWNIGQKLNVIMKSIWFSHKSSRYKVSKWNMNMRITISASVRLPIQRFCSEACDSSINIYQGGKAGTTELVLKGKVFLNKHFTRRIGVPSWSVMKRCRKFLVWGGVF